MPIDEKSLPDSVYPLASQQGAAIPLDVAKPIDGYKDTLAKDQTSAPYVLADSKFNVISVWCSQVAFLQTYATQKPGEPSPTIKTFYLIPNMLYDLIVEQNVTITNEGTDVATVILNHVLRWDQLYNMGAYGVTR